MTDTNKERAAFEAWAVNEGFQIRRLHNPEAGRDYGIDSAQDAWEAWQARAARGAAQAAPTKMPIPPPPVDPFDVVYAEGWNAACEAFFGGLPPADALVITVTEAAPVAPAPQLAPMPYPTDAQIDAVYEQTMSQHLRSQDAPAVRRFGRAMFLCAWNAAAPKAAPAINKVSDIIDAYGMTPGEPERVADIPGLAEALEDAFADGSAQITGATPLQQGEYLPLPVPSGRIEYPAQRYEDAWVSTQDAYSEEQMHAYVDADRAARGAAQAAPAEDDKWRSLALQFDGHRMQALWHLKLLLECGEDHAEAVRTFLAGPPLHGEIVLAQRIAAYAQAQPAPVAEDAEIRKALHDAATSLETISRIAGRDRYMLGMMDVRLYAAARAKVAREAQAAQPEGGAK